MHYRQGIAELEAYRGQIAELREKMRAVQRTIEPQPVEDYVLASAAGSTRLSALFGGKTDLIVIHNMGRGCPYCTLWADGFNGLYPHIADRAAFVVSSPDAPAVQQAFAQSRGWRFPMVSHQGTSFATDMGYRSSEGGWLPGISVFQRKAGGVVRVSDTGMHPHDDYCALWHMLDLMPEGAGDWQPRFSY